MSVAIIYAMQIPLSALTASGNSWLVGKSVLAGVIAFAVALLFLQSYISGMMAVAISSVFGRFIRTIYGYYEVLIILRNERLVDDKRK
ncbi:MAG: hypothetical protein D3923_03050 [Candidatus Electrothrix sp. AR3]|nr:hypothetical protein [Candidatus Electrothrix sp. AR3]